MGNQASSAERDVYELMKALVKKHDKGTKGTLSGHDLKLLLKWVQAKIPDINASSIFTRELWDQVGVKLWDAATFGNEEAQRMLPRWRKVFETIKAQEQGSNEGTKPSAPSDPPLACAAKYPPEEDPFDPGPVDPEKEPDLFPPDPHNDWGQLKRQALREGELEIAKTIVAPVIYPGRGGAAQWEALSFSVIKELRRTVTEHDLSSPYFASLLTSVCDTYIMTPHDLKSLSRLLLTPTQYALWESHWRIGLQTVLLGYAGHQNAALAALTMEHLTGTGQHADPVGQARDIPREALEAIREEAKKAMLKIPDSNKPQKVFTTISQEPREPYMQFIDRLKQALERQVDNVDAREILLLKLAVENANADCKKLLKSLPNQNLTLIEMIEACNRIGTMDYKYETMAAAFAAMKGPMNVNSQQNCYNCGKPGHLKKDCFYIKPGKRPQAPNTCPRCQKGRHYANQCKSKFDVNGRPLSGNRRLSAGMRRAQIQIPQQPSQLVRGEQQVTVSPPSVQQPQGVQAWTWQPPTQ